MSRLASRSLDLRRILPAVTLADNAPPSTPGAARRRGGRRGASVASRGVAYPGTAAGYSRGEPGVAGRRRGVEGRAALAAHPAWSIVVRSSPSRAQRSQAPTTPRQQPRAAASPRSLWWLCQGLRTHGSGSHLARCAAAGRVPIPGRACVLAARGTPRLSAAAHRGARGYGVVTPTPEG